MMMIPDHCTYKPIWDWQTDYFAKTLHNFHAISLKDPSLAHVVMQQDDQSSTTTTTTTVHTKWYASDEYRLIRMTDMDGGEGTQICTTVCYPKDDLPILGHGLLQCGDCQIVIMDFQPVSPHHNHDAKNLLEPIRKDYPMLQTEMSERFFKSGEYWSDYTMLGRFPKSDEEDLWKNLWPSYQRCVQAHVQLVQQQQQKSKCRFISKQELLQKHAAYDTHVASRDPAMPMLTRIFGKEKAEQVVFQALFRLAKPSSSSASPQQQQQQ